AANQRRAEPFRCLAHTLSSVCPRRTQDIEERSAGRLRGMKFANRVAFITGASRGVGKNIALALAREGCDIVAAAKTVEADARLPGTIYDPAAEVEKLGRRALAVQVDVRDDTQVERGIKEALDKMGRIDFLVNNAGALHWRSMLETPMKRFDL